MVFKVATGVLAALVLSVLGLLYWRLPAENSSELAAWVQAVGSIAAILVSVIVVMLQHQLEAEREAAAAKRHHAESLLAWAGLFLAVAEHVDACRALAANQDNSPYKVTDLHDEVKTCVRAAERLDLGALAGWDEVRPVVTGISLSRRVASHLAVTASRMEASQAWASYLDITTQEVSERLRTTSASLQLRATRAAA